MGRNLRFLVALLFSLTSVSSLVRATGPAAYIYTDDPTIWVSDMVPRLVTISVRDADDQPVFSPVVEWHGPSSGPRARVEPIPSEQWHGDGDAEFLLTGIGGFGTYTLTASVAGAGAIDFTVTNFAQPLRLVSGDVQSTTPGTAFAKPLTIEARQLNGQPLIGAEVHVTRVSGGAIVASPTVITDADGLASTAIYAGVNAGDSILIVSAPSVENVFDIYAYLFTTLRAPARIGIELGSDLELPVGGGLRQIKVRVRDASGSIVPGAAVTIQAPSEGPSFAQLEPDYFGDVFVPVPSGIRLFTDNEGLVTIKAGANDQYGSFTVTVQVDGLETPRTLTVTNVPRAPAAIFPNGRPEAEYAGAETALNGRFEHLRFRVVDADGGGIANVTLNLAVLPDGPSVTLDASTIVTDEAGYAETSGTANGVAGSYYVRAQTDLLPAPAYMLMQNLPPGYRPGDQIVDLAAFDHTGTLQSLRSIATGRYLLLDVCTMWCTVCQFTQPMGREMKASLAARGIDVAVAPMLVDSTITGQPSTQANAVAWQTRYRISDPVLHASADPTSPVRSAGEFILGADRPGYPTFLLVGPGGTILARHRGAWNDASDMVDFVLEHVPSAISIASVQVNEGNSVAAITVSRSPANGSASVAFTTATGSASVGDFSARSGQLQFAPGQATATITVPIVDDSIDEPAEQFTVRLSNPTGGTIANGVATVTIADNDAPPTASIADARFAEGTGGVNKVSIPVRLDRASAFAVTVSYHLASLTAKSTDLVIAKGEITIGAGKLVEPLTIEVIGDKLVEAKETFAVELDRAVNATLGVSLATMSIVDDDSDTVAPVMEATPDIVLEVKMSLSSTAIVNYKVPAAKDANEGVVTVTCTPPSGGKYGYGSTKAVCSAEDRAGNLTERAFSIVVRMPTVAGAIFDPNDRTTPLTEADRGATVLVQVNAAAFAARAAVDLTLVDANGRRHSLGRAQAGHDGSLDALVKLFPGATLGTAQLLAESSDHTREYDRAWFLNITKK